MDVEQINTDREGKLPLLFLCHRIPYPPNKGDKIRSFHLLHHLSKHFDIYLATFVDDPADRPYVSEVKKHCKDSLYVDLKPWQATLRSLKGFITGDPLSIPYYTNTGMKNWVKAAVAENNIRHVIVYSSAMAQFILQPEFSFTRKIIDFVDVDSDKWQQYARQKPWPLSWLYRRESDKLLKLERTLSEQFDSGLFVSSAEADMFRMLSPETADKIGFYNNGVNIEYFDPARDSSNPYADGVPTIVFTGAMDYWPNVDAVVWFVHQVLPHLLVESPLLQFYIVGGNPAKKVQRLSAETGVVVTGRVEDIRPYIQHAVLAVAPIRVARGVQNKVLEAMAMEKPVLVSRKGLEGIDAVHGEQLLIADEVDEYINLVQRILRGDFPAMGSKARTYVAENFNWDENLPEVVFLLNQSAGQISHRGDPSS